jgi:hypothetical protein
LIWGNFETLDWLGFEKKLNTKIHEIISAVQESPEITDTEMTHSYNEDYQIPKEKLLEHVLNSYKEKEIINPIKKILELMLKDFICFMMDEYNFRNFVDLAKFKAN